MWLSLRSWSKWLLLPRPLSVFPGGSSLVDFPVAQTVKRLPTMWETRIQSLGQEDPLEKEMATHSSVLAWEISRTEKPGRLQSMGSQRVGHDLATEQQQPIIKRKLEESSLQRTGAREVLGTEAGPS